MLKLAENGTVNGFATKQTRSRHCGTRESRIASLRAQ
jgi:hypothetical protein